MVVRIAFGGYAPGCVGNDEGSLAEIVASAKRSADGLREADMGERAPAAFEAIAAVAKFAEEWKLHDESVRGPFHVELHNDGPDYVGPGGEGRY